MPGPSPGGRPPTRPERGPREAPHGAPHLLVRPPSGRTRRKASGMQLERSGHPSHGGPGRPAPPRRGRRRVAVLVTALVASLLVGLPAGARGPAFPESLPLPDGFYPEGITIGVGQDFFVGSLLDGALYRGNLRTGDGSVIAPGAEGRWLVGLDHDARSGLVWAAGIDAGAGAVLAFDGQTGELVHVVAIPRPGSSTTSSSPGGGVRHRLVRRRPVRGAAAGVGPPGRAGHRDRTVRRLRSSPRARCRSTSTGSTPRRTDAG